jgi:hypothetical protein
MVDDYDYEYKRRRPRRDTYEGSYRRPGQSEYFDPSADILAGIESVEKSIGERKKKVTDFENTAALENQKYQDALADTESMEDTGVVDSLQQNLSDKILELNRLKIASFEGDQTEYLKKSSELNRYIETLPVLMGLIDEEAKTTKDARLNGTFNKEYLKSNNKQYIDFIDAINDGGKGVTFDTKNGNIIAKLNGKEVFNGNAYVKGKKEGFDLINYADGYQKQIDQADTQAYKGLENLVRKDIIKGVEKGDKITGEIAKNYAIARQRYKERLESGEIAIPVNESTYQKYTNFGSENNDKSWGEDVATQSEMTKAAIIESMVENRFPGGDRVVVQTTEEAKKKPTAFEIREQQQKERELRLKEQESKTKIQELTEPKFVNQFKKEYTQSQQVAFETALDKYRDMNILLDQLQDPEFTNKEGVISEEGIAKANNFFPGIKGLVTEKVNTRLKLKTVLNQEFLKGDGTTAGLDYNTFQVMNKDYEELLEKQDKAKYPTVKLASDLNDKEIGSIVNYDDNLYTIVEVGGKKQLEEKK